MYSMVFFTVGITFTVNPSNIVEVNQVVTLQCALDPNPTPPVVVFFSDDLGKTLCLLEPYNGVCKNTSSSCVIRYNGSCSNETLFSIQVKVPLTWNGISLSCKSIFSKSNTINLTVTGTWILFLKLEIMLVVIKFLIHFVRFYPHECTYATIKYMILMILDNQRGSLLIFHLYFFFA